LNRNRIYLIGLFVLLAVPSVYAGNLDNVIASEYPNKILTLRHFYSGERLHLYADGTLVDEAPSGTWTSDGQIEVRDASQNGSVLTIKARRIYQVYDAKRKIFVDAITLLPTYPEKLQKEVEKSLKKRQVEIRIEMPPTPDPKEIPETLHAVFLAPGESAANVVPPYYRDFFAKREGRLTPPDQATGDLRLALAGSKSADKELPRPTFSPDPEYSESARQLKFQGTVVVSLMIDPSGLPRDPQILLPVGVGLDDAAIAAVSKWKFAPAERDGKPVATTISVEIDFHLD
jgi:TonB family protein